MNKRKYPESWKISQVSPIFKKGNNRQNSCYRPISLFCCSSQIYEKLIFYEPYEYCKHYLHENKFGCSEKLSAIIELLIFFYSKYSKLNDKQVEELTVFHLDFAKAFDKVDQIIFIR